ncbi:MAG: hypothetical protein IT383_09965 [Deltaproteobacteria bacterium]|nr:hypothetical protein [Deltaproteobacteria bacterium]
MSFISRVFNGAVRAISAPFNVLKTGFNALLAEGKTILQAGSELLKGNFLSAAGTLIGGTVKNAVNAGVSLAVDGNPVTAFAHGALTDSNGWTGKQGWLQ